MTPGDNTAEHDLARFAVAFSVDALDDTTLDRIRWVVADSVAAIVGGSTSEPVTDQAHASSPDGECTVLGTDVRTTPGHAALLNGTAGTTLELDEGHRYAAGHPAMHVFPAVLAAAEADGGTGRELFSATVAGYEVAARVGRAVTPLREEYHMHGLWGTVGGAAGVARYRGLDVETALQAMRIAANYALHTRWETATEGATVRDSYAGMSNMQALLAVNQASAGFTGLQRGIERHLDRVSRSDFERTALGADLGERYEISRGYFKRHSACRYTHGAIDAVARLQSAEGLTPSDVASVLVETYESAATLDDTAPENPLQARFSIPFTVATRLVRGHAGKEAFEPNALDATTLDLAGAVEVESASDLAERVPDVRASRVTATTTDGRTLTEEVEFPAGDDRNPLSRAQLREKFHSLVDPVVGSSTGDRLLETVLDLPDAHPRGICRLASR